ncbi:MULTISPECIES: ribonuclease E inhibitor RraB [Shewanella]|uniref:ribonuclease E inhibitor RraB n=1 Tax=Shewanella TaxID=22 RepID=UPI00048C30B9|nr:MULTISPECIES: ribonuclease E inhibitor RraB [Shewanella]QLE87033.1 ribonuclease E inhibitor RraB [Shewanella sp. Scap07]
MSVAHLLQQQQQENKEIVEAVLADGSNPEAEYTIEHHFSSAKFDALEKAAVELFKLGFEVNDAEELELEDGKVIYCFDAIAYHNLEVALLDKACEELINLAAKLKVDYDGWGTYFIDENGEEYREDEDDDDEQNQFH